MTSMSFEVTFAPPRERLSRGPDDNEVLCLAPFSGPTPRIFFKNIVVGETVSRRLRIRNPQDFAVEIQLHKLPQNNHLECSKKKFLLQPKEEEILELTWSPKEEGKWVYVVNVRTDSNFKSSFTIVCTSIRQVTKKKIVRKVLKKQPAKIVSKPAICGERSQIPRSNATDNCSQRDTFIPDMTPRIQRSPHNISHGTTVLSNSIKSGIWSGVPNVADQICTGSTKSISTHTYIVGTPYFSESMSSDKMCNAFENKYHTPKISTIDETDVFEKFSFSPLTGRSNTHKGAQDEAFLSPHFLQKTTVETPNLHVPSPLPGLNTDEIFQKITFRPLAGPSKIKKEEEEVHNTMCSLFSQDANSKIEISPDIFRPLTEVEVEKKPNAVLVRGSLQNNVPTQPQQSFSNFQFSPSIAPVASRADSHLSPILDDLLHGREIKEEEITGGTNAHLLTEPYTGRNVGPQHILSPVYLKNDLPQPLCCSSPNNTATAINVFSSSMQLLCNTSNTQDPHIVNYLPEKATSENTIEERPVEEGFFESDENNVKENIPEQEKHEFKSLPLRAPLQLHLPANQQSSSKVRSTHKRRFQSPGRMKANSGLPIRRLILTSKKRIVTEKSKILQDADKILAEHTNPCLPATVINPFLKSSVYFSQEWFDDREKEFVRWLNVLLTPPEELSSCEEVPKVDVARLWDSSCHSQVAPAPSREAVSSQYLVNHRLDSVRRAACTLFRSHNVAQVLAKVSVQVDKEILKIRDDRNMSRDIGLSLALLELLLSYNSLWLRIGLETVYGKTIPLQSNSDSVGLTKFLTNNFLSDQYLERQYAISGVSKMYKPGFESALMKFILKKFLFLVYFLDYAKENKLIVHNPCLFCKNSPYKESREILLTFAREFLCGIGDITKHLRNIGYVVKHKQIYLHEYNYAVTNLGADLRDGVRLTRVMEIVLQKTELSSQLRTPVQSILQKIHNVKVALKAMQDAGFSLDDKITPKEIVEGHKEKTMSLLWQIIYKFQAPRYLAAAVQIQKWYSSLHICITRRIRRREKEKLAKAKQLQACITIQKHWRGYSARKHCKIMINSIHKLQVWYRTVSATRKCRQLFLKKKWAATVVEKYWCLKLQNRLEIQKKDIAARHIQAWFKATLLMRKQRYIFLQSRNAAVLIQVSWRARCLIKLQNGAALRIQSAWRARCLMKQQREIFNNQKRAALKIQSAWRARCLMKQQREIFNQHKHAALKIQSAWRARCLMKQQRETFNNQKRAALTIQSAWRARCLMKQQRETFNQHKHAALKIQSAWRARCLMKQQREIFNQHKHAALKIQSAWRARCLMKQQRETFNNQKRAALTIQSAWRARCLMKQQRETFNQHKHAALKIQSAWRARCLMKQQRETFNQHKHAALKIQSAWRARCLMKQQREIFNQHKHAALKIQSAWRARCLMKQQREIFNQHKHAALKIQSAWRARCLMKQQRETFNNQKRAALTIQSAWRARCLMKQQRETFNQHKHAALKIQSAWRARCLMKQQREIFNNQKRAALTIQSAWRARCLMKQQREIFNNQKRVALTIQSACRARCLMKQQRETFNQQEHATLKIQSWWRATCLMRKRRELFCKMVSAVVKIQVWWRKTNVQPSQRKCIPKLEERRSLRYQYKMSLKNLEHSVSYAVLQVKLTLLETALYLSPEICGEFLFSEHLPVIFQVALALNRSCPSEKIGTIILKIIINILRHPLGPARFLEVSESVNALQKLTVVWCGKKIPIFSYSCTAWWLLAQDPHRAEHLVAIDGVKHKLLKCYAKEKDLYSKTRSTTYSLPEITPSWNVIPNRGPRFFENSFFAITQVLKSLNISVQSKK